MLELPPMEYYDGGETPVYIIVSPNVQVDCDNGIIIYRSTLIKVGKCNKRERENVIYVEPL